MSPRVLAPVRSRRDLVLDWATVAVAAVLLILATTALNRLPYPGRQRYAHRVTVILGAPLVPALSESMPDILPAPTENNDEAQ
jgi:hypothetical protein